MTTETGAIIGVLIVNAATLITQWLKSNSDAKREIRQRQWAVEDRNVIAQHVAKTVEQASTTITEKVEQVDQTSRTARQVLYDLVNDTKNIAKDAFHEANGTKLLLAEEVKRRNALLQGVIPPPRVPMADGSLPERRHNPGGSTEQSGLDGAQPADPSADPQQAVIEATTKLAEKTEANTEATRNLAEQIANMPPSATAESREQRRETLGAATVGLIVEMADSARAVETHTKNAAETLKELVEQKKQQQDEPKDDGK